MNLTASVLKIQKKIKWANHLVFFFPIWWATPPALLKVFLEIVLHPNFAYKYTKPLFGIIPQWNKLLKGRSARIVTTMGGPTSYYRWIIGEPAFNMMKANLKFCGIKSVRRNYFGSVELSSEKRRKKWIERIYEIGLRE